MNHISFVMLKKHKTRYITSEMIMTLYDSNTSYNRIVLPFGDKPSLYFISDTTLINRIISFETDENNIYTERRQAYKYNRALLENNPVATSSLNAGSYLKQQHVLFAQLSKSFDVSTVIFNKKCIRGREISNEVILAVSSVYLPILLNVDAADVIATQPELIVLLSLLEKATGKHHITIGEYISDAATVYSNKLERKYINAFYALVLKLKHCKDSTLTSKTEHIVELLDDSNIMNVLKTQFTAETDASAIVNNILSWIDNMLNVVYTIINSLIIIATKYSGEYREDEHYNKILQSANALATMFMRKVIRDFDISDELKFKVNDIIMMSDRQNIFGGKGRKCPSAPWSYTFIKMVLRNICGAYSIKPIDTVAKHDTLNRSWFWYKLSPDELELNRLR